MADYPDNVPNKRCTAAPADGYCLPSCWSVLGYSFPENDDGTRQNSMCVSASQRPIFEQWVFACKFVKESKQLVLFLEWF